jgi:hypothetical protein
VSAVTSEDIWAIAERVCTGAQLDALRLQAAGFSERRIASIIGITRSAVQDRLAGAFLKIRQAAERSTLPDNSP